MLIASLHSPRSPRHFFKGVWSGVTAARGAAPSKIPAQFPSLTLLKIFNLFLKAGHLSSINTYEKKKILFPLLIASMSSKNLMQVYLLRRSCSLVALGRERVECPSARGSSFASANLADIANRAICGAMPTNPSSSNIQHFKGIFKEIKNK